MRIYLIGGAVVLSLAVASNLAFGGLLFDHDDHDGPRRGWHSDRFEQGESWPQGRTRRGLRHEGRSSASHDDGDGGDVLFHD